MGTPTPTRTALDATSSLLQTLPPAPPGRPAAVLVSLWPPSRERTPSETVAGAFPSDWRLLYILRGNTGGPHDGQVAFPGGAVEESDEGPVAAAFREAEEELGLDVRGLAFQGYLTPLAIPLSGFAVTPVVAVADRSNPSLKDAPGEVSGHFFVPLHTLVEVRASEPFLRAGRLTRFPVFEIAQPEGSVQPARIWGATAWMTANLLDRLFPDP